MIKYISILFLFASLNAQIIIAPSHYSSGGAGESCTGYLVCQNFGGTGYDNGETWTEVSGPNPDYTGTILRGSQSLLLENVAGDSIRIGEYTDFWAFLRFRTNDGTPAVARNFFAITEGNGLTVCARITLFTSGYLRVYNGTANLTGTTTQLANNTTYYIWLHGVKGAGTGDGVSTVYIDTDNTRPASAEVTITTGTWDSDNPNTHRLFIYNAAGAGADSMIIDQVLIDDAEIIDVDE